MILYSLYLASWLQLGSVQRIEATGLTLADCLAQAELLIDEYDNDAASCEEQQSRDYVGVYRLPSGVKVHPEKAPDGRFVYPEILVGNDRAIMDAILNY